ncbi:MAG: YvcK family protein [Firmicutes bacterium]|nr:YvcK family protein [Bacillota bacterium]
MKKKIVVLGGGTGMSTLLRGLKQFPVDITAIVSVCDDGQSTGRLRQEFNTIAVGDIRRVLVSLSEVEPLVEKLFNYRFHTTSDLDGHTVGNLLLTAMSNINGNLSEGIEALAKIMNLKGKVLPLTEDNVVLMADMKDGKTVVGEHHITETKGVIERVYYQNEPIVSSEVVRAIKQADLVLLSMGSLYTSIIPNLICKEVVKAIDASKANVMYVCNMMTQPGETDNFTVADHIEVLNRYLGQHKVDSVIMNEGKIDKKLREKYADLEQKDPVTIDIAALKTLNVKTIEDDFVIIEDGVLRHNTMKLAFHIFSSLL